MTLTNPIGVAASDEIVSQVAEEALRSGHGALAAALAGYFAAAGRYPGVLLGSFALLVSSGASGRAFDGRLRQPGIGGRRPRGFVDHQRIPDTARVAVPCSVLAAGVALAYDGRGDLHQLVRAGIRLAKAAGTSRRGEALEALAAQGASAFSRSPFERALLRAGSPSEGGNLTAEDLTAVPEVDLAAAKTETGFQLPWQAAGTTDADQESHGICVADPSGTLVGIAYSQCLRGISIPDLDLLAPALGVPVLRGVERVSPGSALPSSAHIVIECDDAPRARRVTVAQLNSGHSRGHTELTLDSSGRVLTARYVETG